MDIPAATVYATIESCQGWREIQTSEQEEQQSCSHLQAAVRNNWDSNKPTRCGRRRWSDEQLKDCGPHCAYRPGFWHP